MECHKKLLSFDSCNTFKINQFKIVLLIFRSSDILSLAQRRHLAQLLPSSYGSGKIFTFAIRLDFGDMY